MVARVSNEGVFEAKGLKGYLAHDDQAQWE